jgi:putative NADH-flavin reductase
MKQILIVLILCLIGTSQANSQTLLNDTTCCVPCATLRKALVLKEDHKLTVAELGVARDSINLYVKQGVQKDSVIIEQKSIITEKDCVIVKKTEITTERDNQIKDLNHNIKVFKRQRNIVLGGSGALLILTLLLLL